MQIIKGSPYGCQICCTFGVCRTYGPSATSPSFIGLVMAHYILQGHDVVLCEDWVAWAIWFGGADRAVAKDVIKRKDCDTVTVSTMFLGHDSRTGIICLPIVFESMVFGGPLNGTALQYCNWEDAQSGHRNLLAESVTEAEFAAWNLRIGHAPTLGAKP